jgi:hypothetical protein
MATTIDQQVLRVAQASDCADVRIFTALEAPSKTDMAVTATMLKVGCVCMHASI